MIARQITLFLSSTPWTVRWYVSFLHLSAFKIQFYGILLVYNQGWRHRKGGGAWPSTFLHSKKRKEKQKKKEFQSRNCSKAVLAMLQGCFRASRIYKFFLAANHGDWQYLLAFHVPSTLKSISPVLICLAPNSIPIWP